MEAIRDAMRVPPSADPSASRSGLPHPTGPSGSGLPSVTHPIGSSGSGLPHPTVPHPSSGSGPAPGTMPMPIPAPPLATLAPPSVPLPPVVPPPSYPIPPPQIGIGNFTLPSARPFKHDGSELISEWLASLANHFDAIGVPHERRVALALPLLTGPSASWASQPESRRVALHNYTWAEFVEELVATFEPVDRSYTYRQHLMDARPKRGESIVDFCQRYRVLRLRCPEIADSEVYHMFLRSVPDAMKWEIRSRDYLNEDFEGALALVSNLGGLASSMQVPGFNPTNQTRVSKGKSRGRGGRHQTSRGGGGSGSSGGNRRTDQEGSSSNDQTQ